MADMEPYRVEPAKSDRSTCTVSKEKIDKGEVRFGSLLMVSGKGSYKWRKLSCITKKQVDNIQEKLGGPEKVNGFAELTPAQQVEVVSAFEAAASAVVPGKSKAKAEAASSTPAKKLKTGKASAAKLGDASMATSSSEPVSGPTPTTEMIKAAHALIDLAKNAQWEDLYHALDKQSELVNVRPDVRDYAVLHQAAFHGAEMAVATLVDKYGADPAQCTKHGKSVVEVAEEYGHAKVAKLLLQRLSVHGTGPSSSGSLSPEKVSKAASSAASASSSAVPAPILTADVLKGAHKLIDLAKEAMWDSVFEALSKRGELVNARPEVREYGVLHQAVFYGDREAVDKLIDKYGADPEQLTKSGKSAIDIAEDRGHEHIAKSLRKRLGKSDGDDFDSYMSAHEEIPAAEEEEDDSGIELVQMPDGSWKVMQVDKKEKPAVPEVSMSSHPAAASSHPAAASSTASGSVPLPPAAHPPPMLPAEPPSATAIAGSKTSTVADFGAAKTAVMHIPADKLFTEAGSWHVYCGEGSAWHCTLKQGARISCVLQVLEDVACSSYRVWSRWGPNAEGHDVVVPCSSAGAAVVAFRSKFFERTNNKWEDRKRFKPYFGKYTYVKADDELEGPVAAPAVTPYPELTTTVIEEAHKLIDRAKAGRWDDLFKALDKNQELINVRPDVREYSVLQQAAFYGKADVLTTLIDRYGADPLQRTKSGRSLIDVAKEGGNGQTVETATSYVAKVGLKVRA